MGFSIRFIVNFILVAPPIAITLGVLFGLQAQRAATGGPPLFGGPSDGDGDEFAPDNGIKNNTYCQKAFGIHPDTKGQEYTLNPNQWGWDEGTPGWLCMNVTSFNNQTWATDTTAPEFSVTWEYPIGPQDAPVHAFPNIKVDGGVFPKALSAIKGVQLDFEWTMGVGNDTVAKTDVAALDKAAVNANVAMDMFLDADKDKALESDKAKYEIMVWFARIGGATHPIGLDDGAVAKEKVNGTDFSLYVGQNGNKQNVLTWVSDTTTDRFHGDLEPLIAAILKLEANPPAAAAGAAAVSYPSSSDFLGYLSLGTEAYSSSDSVTFHVPALSIDINTSAARQ